jgi:hypothetical protein
VRTPGPRIVQLRGWTLPRAGRNGRYAQAASYQAECPCGWTSTRTDSDTAARGVAITHTQEAHS